MTREKKELLKQLQAINEEERLCFEMDSAMGELPEWWYIETQEEYYDKKLPIYKKLNELMHGRLNDFFGACVI